MYSSSVGSPGPWGEDKDVVAALQDDDNAAATSFVGQEKDKNGKGNNNNNNNSNVRKNSIGGGGGGASRIRIRKNSSEANKGGNSTSSVTAVQTTVVGEQKLRENEKKTGNNINDDIDDGSSGGNKSDDNAVVKTESDDRDEAKLTNENAFGGTAEDATDKKKEEEEINEEEEEEEEELESAYPILEDFNFKIGDKGNDGEDSDAASSSSSESESITTTANNNNMDDDDDDMDEDVKREIKKIKKREKKKQLEEEWKKRQAELGDSKDQQQQRLPPPKPEFISPLRLEKALMVSQAELEKMAAGAGAKSGTTTSASSSSAGKKETGGKTRGGSEQRKQQQEEQLKQGSGRQRKREGAAKGETVKEKENVEKRESEKKESGRSGRQQKGSDENPENNDSNSQKKEEKVNAKRGTKPASIPRAFRDFAPDARPSDEYSMLERKKKQLSSLVHSRLALAKSRHVTHMQSNAVVDKAMSLLAVKAELTRPPTASSLRASTSSPSSKTRKKKVSSPKSSTNNNSDENNSTERPKTSFSTSSLYSRNRSTVVVEGSKWGQWRDPLQDASSVFSQATTAEEAGKNESETAPPAAGGPTSLFRGGLRPLWMNANASRDSVLQPIQVRGTSSSGAPMSRPQSRQQSFAIRKGLDGIEGQEEEGSLPPSRIGLRTRERGMEEEEGERTGGMIVADDLEGPLSEIGGVSSPIFERRPASRGGGGAIVGSGGISIQEDSKVSVTSLWSMLSGPSPSASSAAVASLMPSSSKFKRQQEALQEESEQVVGSSNSSFITELLEGEEENDSNNLYQRWEYGSTLQGSSIFNNNSSGSRPFQIPPLSTTSSSSPSLPPPSFLESSRAARIVVVSPDPRLKERPIDAKRPWGPVTGLSAALKATDDTTNSTNSTSKLRTSSSSSSSPYLSSIAAAATAMLEASPSKKSAVDLVNSDYWRMDVSHALDQKSSNQLLPIPDGVPETVVAKEYKVSEAYPIPPGMGSRASEVEYVNGTWELKLFPMRNPTGRREVQHLGHWFECEWQRGMDESQGDAARVAANAEQLQTILSVAFFDLVRQFYVHCTERGRLAELVWQRQVALYHLVHARMRDLERTLEEVEAAYDELIRQMKNYFDNQLLEVHHHYGKELAKMAKIEKALRKHILTLEDRLRLTKEVANNRAKDVLVLEINALRMELNRLAKRAVLVRDLLLDSCDDWENREVNKMNRIEKSHHGEHEHIEHVVGSLDKQAQIKFERHIRNLHAERDELRNAIERYSKDNESLRGANLAQVREISLLKREIARLKRELADEKAKRPSTPREKKDSQTQTTGNVTVEDAEGDSAGAATPTDSVGDQLGDDDSAAGTPGGKKKGGSKLKTAVQKFMGYKAGLGLLINYKTLKPTFKPMQYKLFLKMVDEILKLKAQADAVDDRANNPRQSLPEFVYDYMTNKYGLKSLAEQNVFAVMQTVHVYRDRSVKIDNFARFLNFYDPLPLSSLNFYLDAMATLKTAPIAAKIVEEVNPLGAAAPTAEKDTVVISLQRVAALVPLVFFPIDEATTAEVIDGLVKTVPTLLITRLPQHGDDTPDYDIERVLLFFLNEVQRLAARKKDALLQLFRDADDNGDGELTVEEFIAFAQGVNDKLSEDECVRMHSEMLAQSGGPAIDPEVFVEVSLKYRLIKDAEGTQLDTEISERLAAISVQKGSTAALVDLIDEKGNGLNKAQFVDALNRIGFNITKLQGDVIFSRCDKNGDGILGKFEFLFLLQDETIDKLCCAAFNETTGNPQQAFRLVDPTGMQRPISKSEFVEGCMQIPSNVLIKEQLESVFERWPRSMEMKELSLPDFSARLATFKTVKMRQFKEAGGASQKKPPAPGAQAQGGLVRQASKLIRAASTAKLLAGAAGDRPSTPSAASGGSGDFTPSLLEDSGSAT